MTVGITASQLKLAGFDDETIIGHIEDQRPLLVQAGFSNNQIDKFYGIERTSPHPLHDSDLNTHNMPVNTESTTASNEQDVSTTWAEKRAKEDSATATNDTKVNNSNTKETTSAIKQGDTVNVDQSNIVTMVDQVIDNPDSIAFGKTPDYNEQLYKTIADQNAALAKTEAEMKANGLIYLF